MRTVPATVDAAVLPELFENKTFVCQKKHGAVRHKRSNYMIPSKCLSIGVVAQKHILCRYILHAINKEVRVRIP